MNIRKFLAGAMVPAFLVPSPHAEEARRGDEPIFLSLTRTAEPAARMPSNVSVITSEELERTGARTLDEALELLPSLDVQKTATAGQYSSLRIRGVPDSKQVLVVVDDQPLGGVFLQDLDIGQLSVADMERIEVVRGGASVLYGANTIGGVIHIITKKAVDGPPRSSVGYEMRSYGTQVQRADLRRKDGRADINLIASSFRTEGFQQNSDGDGLTITGSGGYTFASGARLALEATRLDNNAGDPQGTPIPFEHWNGEWEKKAVDATARVTNRNTLVRGKGVFPAGRAVVQTTFYGSNQDYVSANAFSRYALDKNILGNDTRFLLPGKAVIGASYERDEYRSKGDPKLHGTDWGLYAQKTFTFGPLDLMPAFRMDQHGAFGNTHNPRLTAVVRATKNIRFSANAGRSFRSPTLLDLNQSYAEVPPFPGFSGYSAFLANKQLRPEVAMSYDAGVQLTPTPAAAFSVTGFFTRIRDRIAGSANAYPTPNTNINAPRAETSGLEVESVGRAGPVSHRVSYTYQRAVGNSLASTTYAPLRRTPRHLGNARLSWDVPRAWTFTAGVQYVSRQFENDGEGGAVLPPYTLWNARVAKTVLGAELYLAGDNLTNRRYADAFGYGVLIPQPGRTFWGGMTIRFQD